MAPGEVEEVVMGQVSLKLLSLDSRLKNSEFLNLDSEFPTVDSEPLILNCGYLTTLLILDFSCMLTIDS